jgi:hypothetical protein
LLSMACCSCATSGDCGAKGPHGADQPMGVAFLGGGAGELGGGQGASQLAQSEALLAPKPNSGATLPACRVRACSSASSYPTRGGGTPRGPNIAKRRHAPFSGMCGVTLTGKKREDRGVRRDGIGT